MILEPSKMTKPTLKSLYIALILSLDPMYPELYLFKAPDLRSEPKFATWDMARAPHTAEHA